MNFLFVVLGLISGIAGGMGMGGGTLLIPLITLFLGIAQKQAQFLNIFSFVFMAIIVVIIHIKNKMVEIYPSTIFALFGVCSAIFSALLVKKVDNSTLRILFGIFIIIIALIQLAFFVIAKKQKK